MKKSLLLALGCLFWSASPAQTVSLYAPSNGTTVNGTTALLQWIDVAGESGFVYQVDTVNTFDSPNLNSGTSPAFTSGTGFPAAGVSNLLFATTYYWRVAAVVNNSQAPWSNVRTFNTISQPTLHAPINGSVVDINVVLQWNDVAGETGYAFQIDTVSTFDSPDLQSGTVGAFNNSSGFPATGVGILEFGTTYYWRVAIQNGASQSNWSNPGNFTTVGRPALYSPSNDQLMNGISVVLQWYNYSGETGYKYQVDTVSTFDSPNLQAGTTGPMTSTGFPSIGIGNLAFGTTYYWRVAILSAVGESEWSFVRTFNTVLKPTLHLPNNGAVNVGSSVSLNWYNIAGESGFSYQLDTTPEFNSPNLQLGTLPEYTSSIGYPGISFNNLLANTTYFWRIAFLNGASQSEWSPTWVFGTGATILETESHLATAFTVYPNPVSDRIFIAGNENPAYTFTSLDGRTISSGVAIGGSIELNLVPPGIYLLRLSSDRKAQTVKIVKK